MNPRLNEDERASAHPGGYTTQHHVYAAGFLPVDARQSLSRETGLKGEGAAYRRRQKKLLTQLIFPERQEY